MFTEDVFIFHSIDETWKYLTELKSNLIVYYHNLKFDGNFWISFFLNKLHLKQAYTGDGINSCEWCKDKEMYSNTFKYTISEMGQWYSIKVKSK